MAESLKQSLDLYHMDSTQADRRTPERRSPKGTVRKTWIVDAVDKRVREIAASTDFVGSLGQAERAILALLLKNGGVGTQRTITLPLMKAGLIYVEGQDVAVDRPRLRDVVLRLMLTGLVLNLDDLTNASTRRLFEPFDKIGIAPEVGRVLPRKLLTVPEPSSTVQSVATPPRVKRRRRTLPATVVFPVGRTAPRTGEPAQIWRHRQTRPAPHRQGSAHGRRARRQPSALDAGHLASVEHPPGHPHHD